MEPADDEEHHVRHGCLSEALTPAELVKARSDPTALLQRRLSERSHYRTPTSLLLPWAEIATDDALVLWLATEMLKLAQSPHLDSRRVPSSTAGRTLRLGTRAKESLALEISTIVGTDSFGQMSKDEKRRARRGLESYSPWRASSSPFASCSSAMLRTGLLGVEGRVGEVSPVLLRGWGGSSAEFPGRC